MTRNDIRACLNTLQFLKRTQSSRRTFVGGLVISDVRVVVLHNIACSLPLHVSHQEFAPAPYGIPCAYWLSFGL